MSNLDLKLITIEEVVFSGAAARVTIPTAAGQITVLPRHIPLVSQLRSGTITIHEEGGSQKKFLVAGGILEVRKNSQVIILADSLQAQG